MNDNTAASSAPPAIQGTVAPGFERVREAFAEHFRRDDVYRELGAALAVYRGGKPVVDLWGGHMDAQRQRPWQRDTLINVYSTTKGIAATAMAMLVDEGKLAYGDLVTQHWPEFGANGKGSITIAQLLSHQAGLTGFAEPTTQSDLNNWRSCVDKLARQAPFIPPGTAASYHAMTWGYLMGEVFRRAAGETLGSYIGRRISRVIGADVFVGLPATQERRVAEMRAPLAPPDLSALTQPREALMALINPQLNPEVPNDREWRAAEIPAANGQASAQGLARVYAALAGGGEFEGKRLLARAGIARMLERQKTGTDWMLGFTDNWAMGMCYNQFGMLGPNPETFGHGGWGGSFGAAHLESKLGIGYVCNQMGGQLVGDPRAVALCNAIFESL